ncbi:MAG TPA: hypothetical protein VFB25_01715 [Gaiellaceae bacterium]|nr:hypothetical protein [Gaiellaceae bacterium]
MRPALVALALVTAVIAAGCGTSTRTVTTIRTVTVATTPTTTSAASTPLPPHFDPTSFTAISGDQFWLLGNGVIASTTNGGRSFRVTPAPPLPEPPGLDTQLRFADREDGFAFNSSVFYVTHDGGGSWHEVSLRSIEGFATAGGYAYAVTATCANNGCSDYRFERSPVGKDAWTALPMPFTPDGSAVDVAAHGSSVWLLGTPKGGDSSAIARSADGGQTFKTTTSPCTAGLGGDLEPSSDQVLWAVCPTGMEAGGWISTDGGATFGQLATPELVNSAQLAPASDDVAVLAQGPNATLLRTADGGRTWSHVTTPGGASSVDFIGFTDANTGVALVTRANSSQQELWRTTDGGATWTAVSL